MDALALRSKFRISAKSNKNTSVKFRARARWYVFVGHVLTIIGTWEELKIFDTEKPR